MAGSVVTPTPAPIMEEPKKAPTKRKSTKAKVAEPVVSPAEVNAEAKQSMSAEAFLKSCNKRLVAIKDFSLRGFIVRDLKAMFQLDYGIKSLKELPADKVDECAVKFNAILEAVR